MSGVSRTGATKASTLPKIRTHTKDGSWEGYVNALVVSKDQERFPNGQRKRGLWYLSFILPPRSEVAGGGIANTFFTNSEKNIQIDSGCGMVTLGNRMPSFADLRYPIHWRCTSEAVEDGVQYVIESPFLTTFDITKIQQLSRKRRGEQKNRKKTVVASTADTRTSMELAIEQEAHAEAHPLFLLLIPGSKKDDAQYREQLHVTFLEKRCPFDLQDRWSSFLWQRALEKDEVTSLYTWSYSYQPPQDEDAELPGEEKEQRTEVVNPSLPLLSESWLCRPDIPAILTDLKAFLNPSSVTQEIAEEQPIA